MNSMPDREEARRKARERVQAGMQFLDERVEGWQSRLDHPRLDLRSPFSCVLGELFGTYSKGCDALGLSVYESDRLDNWTRTREATERLGFEADLYPEDAPELVDYADLQDAWAEALDQGIPTAAQLGIEHDYIPDEDTDEATDEDKY